MEGNRAEIQRRDKTIIKPGLKNLEIMAGRKTLMRECNPHCRCSKNEAVGMEHASAVGQIQKEWMLFAIDSKMSSYKNLSNIRNQWFVFCFFFFIVV